MMLYNIHVPTHIYMDTKFRYGNKVPKKNNTVLTRTTSFDV